MERRIKTIRLMRIALLFIAMLSYTFSLMAQNNANVLKSSIWQQKNITVSWDNPTPANQADREFVRKTIAESWEKYCSIRFVGWEDSKAKPGDVRIKISDTVPHAKRLGNKLKGVVGGVVLNFTFKNFSPDCLPGHRDLCMRAFAIHEFGHVLGFAHGQNNPACEFPGCTEPPSGDLGDWDISNCERESIMNYCSSTWNNGGKLSAGDVRSVQVIYPPLQNNGLEFLPQLRIAYNSSYRMVKSFIFSKRFYRLRIYVVKDLETIDKIEKVVYHLDKSDFKNPEMTTTDPSSRFGITLDVFGTNEISAEVFFKDGTRKTLIKSLDPLAQGY